MPSAAATASAKIEKQNSTESEGPLKLVKDLVEKKIRNLEKRKSRLEQLQEEVKSGKSLHEDQQKAVKKYDDVIEILDFFREFSKSVATIFQENLKAAKKAAKREQVERQQQESERLKNVLLFQEVLKTVVTEPTRSDFVKGVNGAQKLQKDKLNQLKELHKSVTPDKTKDGNFSKQMDEAAERLLALVEGKNKEAVKGATFKDMKDLLVSCQTCGYFERDSKQDTGDSISESEAVAKGKGIGEDQPKEKISGRNAAADFVPAPSGNSNVSSQHQNSQSSGGQFQGSTNSVQSKPGIVSDLIGQQPIGQQQPPTVGSGFNFLQESRIEMEATLMDPAVVAVHAATFPGQYVGPGIDPSDMTIAATKLPPFAEVGSPHIPTQLFVNANYMGGVVPQTLSPHHTSSPDIIQGTDQLQAQSFIDPNLADYQMTDTRLNQVVAGQEKPYTSDDYGQNPNFAGPRRDFRGGRRGGRGGAGTGAQPTNGYQNRSNDRRGPRGEARGGYQGASYGGNNSFGTNSTPTYGNSDKRGAPANSQYAGRQAQGQGNQPSRGSRGGASNRGAPAPTPYVAQVAPK